MTVKELIKELKKCDPKAQVILQKDSEGNGFSPLFDVDGDCIYVPDSTWSGDVYDASWDAEDAGMEEFDWKETLKAPRCVVLGPVN